MKVVTTRKLNQVRNSFYVYLPRQWCDRFNLTKHSEVRIEQTSDGTLRVIPPDFESKDSENLTFTVNPDDRESVVNLLIGAYMVGVGSLTVTFGDELDMTTREEVSRWIRRLPGFEILEEYNEGFVISDTSEKQVITPILKRQFSTTKYMLTSLLTAMKEGAPKDTSRILDRDEDVDRHRYFVERLCHLSLQDPSYARKIAMAPPDALHFSLAAKYVERIADHICGATTEVINLKDVGETFIDLSESLAEVYDDTMSVFFAVDRGRREKRNLIEESQEAFDSLKGAQKLASELSKLETIRKNFSSHQVLLAMHLERVASYCADIGEVAINRTIESRLQD